jgi:hypothetical protein
MLTLVIVLLVVWAIVSIVGFALHGLLWIGIVGIVLFIGTGLIALIRRSGNRRKKI